MDQERRTAGTRRLLAEEMTVEWYRLTVCLDRVDVDRTVQHRLRFYPHVRVATSHDRLHDESDSGMHA
jgi:hypothetical protein